MSLDGAIPSSVQGVSLQLSTSIEERSQVGVLIKLAFPDEREDLGATARGFEHLEHLGQASELNVIESSRVRSRLAAIASAKLAAGQVVTRSWYALRSAWRKMQRTPNQ
jgi:hypothetical protein